MKKNKFLILSLSLLLITAGCTNQSDNSSSGTSNSDSNNSDSLTSSENSSNSSVDSTIDSTVDSTIDSTVDSTIDSTVDSSTSDSTSSDSSTTPSVQNFEIKLSKTGLDSNPITADAFTTDSSFVYSSSNKVFFAGSSEYAIKLGSSSSGGSIVFNSSVPLDIKTVKVSAKSYGKDSDVKLNVKLSSNQEVSQDITSTSYQEYTFSFSGSSNVSSLELSTVNSGKKRLYIEKIVLSSAVSSGGQTSSSSESSSSSSSSNSSVSLPSGDDISNPENDPYTGSYYSNISSTKTGDALIKELSKLIVQDSQSYDDLWDGYKLTDLKPGTNYIWDMYSNYNFKVGTDQAGNYSKEGDVYNREHSIPKSWFDDKSPMYTDIMHIVPTDGYVNGRRSNYPFGEVVTATYTSGNGSKLGKDASGTTVFEPIDEYKGDFARIYFYMLTRYCDQVGNWSGGVFQGSYPYLKSKYFDLYLKWAIEDPVSEKEILRNEGVYKFQKNRNPYVDHPSMFYRAFIQN